MSGFRHVSDELEVSFDDDSDGAPDGHGERYLFAVRGVPAEITMRWSLSGEEARALFKALDDVIGLRIAEEAFHQAAWLKASPDERASVLGLEPEDSGYDIGDSKNPGHFEALAGAADHSRKVQKESR